MDADRKTTPSPIRPVPVAYVSQMGTSFAEPERRPFSIAPETATQETYTTTMPSLPVAEMGQGDGTHRLTPQPQQQQPSTPDSLRSPSQPEEELGAVGGAPVVPDHPTSSPSSRVPHLRLPHLDTSLLSEPLRPQYADDRPLSPPVPVAEVEDQANQIIQGFFEERWKQESDVGGEGRPRGELVLGGAAVGGVDPSPPAADAADGRNLGASMLHPDAARSLGGAASSPAPGKDKIKAVSSKLCLIAAEMDQRYSVEFDDMIDLMKLNGSTAYDAFAEVAKQLLSDKITWGKVITLMALGYRMAKRVIDLAIPNFVQNIVSYLTTFICRYVAKWIADRGGWMAILNLEEGISWTGVFGVMSVGCAVLAALSWLKNR